MCRWKSKRGLGKNPTTKILFLLYGEALRGLLCYSDGQSTIKSVLECLTWNSILSGGLYLLHGHFSRRLQRAGAALPYILAFSTFHMPSEALGEKEQIARENAVIILCIGVVGGVGFSASLRGVPEIGGLTYSIWNAPRSSVLPFLSPVSIFVLVFPA